MLVKVYFELDLDNDAEERNKDYVKSLIEIGAESCNVQTQIKSIQLVDQSLVKKDYCPRCKSKSIENLKKWNEGEMSLGIYSCQECDHAWVVEGLI